MSIEYDVERDNPYVSKAINEKLTIISKLAKFFLVYENFLPNNANTDCMHSSMPVIFCNGAVNNSCLPLSSLFTIL